MRYREVAPLDLSNVEVECKACGVRMVAHAGGGGTVNYFRCPSCRRWVSSTYADVLRSDASFHSRPKGTLPRSDDEFAKVKSRLERWLSALDDQDPYRTLGVSPVDTDARVKSRFRELAMECHPDRGGSAEKMRAINAAFEKITAHRTRETVAVVEQQALVS